MTARRFSFAVAVLSVASFASLAAARAGLGLGKLDVLPCRQHRQQKETLEHEPDFPQPEPASISVSNPYLYWSTSIRRTWSTVSCTAGIFPSAHGFKDRGLAMVCSGSAHPCHSAALRSHAVSTLT